MDGKVAVITGAGGGLGRATALELSRRGARVVLVDRAGDDARRTAELLPGESLVVEADVTREDEVAGYLEAARTRFGSIDLHHLNAGIVGTLTPLPQIPLSEFEDVTAVNLRGQFLGMRGAFREYAAQGAGGSIVVTTSIHGLRASADLPVYQMTKHGLVGLVQAGAVYGGPLGVRVNGVAPGLIATRFHDTHSTDAMRKAMVDQTPLRREGTPADVAEGIQFYRDLLGVEVITIFPHMLGDSYKKANEQMTRFMEEVVPLLG